jgi:hypothetical protein
MLKLDAPDVQSVAAVGAVDEIRTCGTVQEKSEVASAVEPFVLAAANAKTVVPAIDPSSAIAKDHPESCVRRVLKSVFATDAQQPLVPIAVLGSQGPVK